MNEKQFLELSDRERDAFIAEKVFGYKIVKTRDPTLFAFVEHPEKRGFEDLLEYQSWQGMGKGIEHANENGWDVDIEYRADGLTDVLIHDFSTVVLKIFSGKHKNPFLAFWLAYMKALTKRLQEQEEELAMWRGMAEGMIEYLDSNPWAE